MAKSLKDLYLKEVVPGLMKRFKYENVMEVPKITKVVISRGVGEGTSNPKAVDEAAQELGDITGQKPAVKFAKKSIAAFKLKTNDPIGCMVTLRKEKMYLFLNKLFNMALPKVRDFKGLSKKSFDGRGNYSFGILEQLIFPEVDYDKVNKVRGMNITIVTTAKSNEEAMELLKLLGVPFKEN
jgi:large subunit ribosomal protein L5